MKKLLTVLIASQFLLYACIPGHENRDDLALIDNIENGLLPPVTIDGEKPESYNIYDRMNHYMVPGVSIAFINNGEIVWAKGYGYTGFDSISAINENTMFQAASISKPIAALAALSLVEEGEITLDDNVNNYLDGWQVPENEFTQTEKVTLRRLLTHSAGLTVHGFGGYDIDADVPSVIQVLNGESPANSGPVYPDLIPGTENRYSGGGYTVMQKIITDLTGKSFPEFMYERVLSKTGMNNSTYEQPLPSRLQSQAAMGHLQNGEMIHGRWHIYPEMAAAGLWTTPSDIMKYAIEVQNSYAGRSNMVISEEMAGEMLTIQIASQGLGPAVRGTGDSLIFGHGGSNAGYRCQFIAFAKPGQGVAIMTNSDNGGGLISEILRSFSNVYEWPMYKPLSKTIYPVDQDKLTGFTGKYKWDQDELIAEITIEGDHLKGLQLWDSTTFEMYPEAELLFFNKEDGASFEFKMNDAGEVSEILIQNSYRFVRVN